MSCMILFQLPTNKFFKTIDQSFGTLNTFAGIYHDSSDSDSDMLFSSLTKMPPPNVALLFIVFVDPKGFLGMEGGSSASSI